MVKWESAFGLSNNKMAMVSVVNWQPTGGLMVQADRPKGRRPPGAVLHSSREPWWTLAMLQAWWQYHKHLSRYYYYYYYYIRPSSLNRHALVQCDTRRQSLGSLIAITWVVIVLSAISEQSSTVQVDRLILHLQILCTTRAAVGMAFQSPYPRNPK